MKTQKNTKSKKSPLEMKSSPSLKTPLETNSNLEPIVGDVSLLNKKAVEYAVSKGIAQEAAIALIQQHYDNATILLSLK